MTKELYTGLQTKGVSFGDDYRHWTKDVMIQKISTVMGIESPHDPDPTYVLTADNLIKILAIQMRFRFVVLSLLLLQAKSFFWQMWYSSGANRRDWLWEDQTH